jgi:hypothetical protein
LYNRDVLSAGSKLGGLRLVFLRLVLTMSIGDGESIAACGTYFLLERFGSLRKKFMQFPPADAILSVLT